MVCDKKSSFSLRLSLFSLPPTHDWLLYTDAATNPPCICALLFDPRKAVAGLDTQRVAYVRPWTQLFKQTCLIFGLGLLALAAFVEDHGPRLAGKSIWIYMDNNNCLSAMTRGDSNTEAIAILVGRIWGTLQRYHISAWFSRIPSKLNPADLPTRNKRLPFSALKKGSFNSLSFLFRLVKKYLHRLGPKTPKRANIRLH